DESPQGAAGHTVPDLSNPGEQVVAFGVVLHDLVGQLGQRGRDPPEVRAGNRRLGQRRFRRGRLRVQPQPDVLPQQRGDLPGWAVYTIAGRLHLAVTDPRQQRGDDELQQVVVADDLEQAVLKVVVPLVLAHPAAPALGAALVVLLVAVGAGF